MFRREKMSCHQLTVSSSSAVSLNFSFIVFLNKIKLQFCCGETEELQKGFQQL